VGHGDGAGLARANSPDVQETSLRHRGSARFPTPLDWHGQALHPMKFPEAPTRNPHRYHPPQAGSAGDTQDETVVGSREERHQNRRRLLRPIPHPPRHVCNLRIGLTATMTSSCQGRVCRKNDATQGKPRRGLVVGIPIVTCRTTRSRPTQRSIERIQPILRAASDSAQGRLAGTVQHRKASGLGVATRSLDGHRANSTHQRPPGAPAGSCGPDWLRRRSGLPCNRRVRSRADAHDPAALGRPVGRTRRCRKVSVRNLRMTGAWESMGRNGLGQRNSRPGEKNGHRGRKPEAGQAGLPDRRIPTHPTSRLCTGRLPAQGCLLPGQYRRRPTAITPGRMGGNSCAG